MPKAPVVRMTRTATSMPIAKKNVLRRLIVLICRLPLDYKPASKVVREQKNCSDLWKWGIELLISIDKSV